MAIRVIQESEERPPLRFVAPDDPPEAIQPPRDEPLASPPPKPLPPAREVRVVQFPTAETVAVLSILMKILGTRVILLVAGIGAFALAMVALDRNSIQSIITSALYDGLVFAHCIYLAIRREA
jgi:hypothetical protein